MKICAIIPSYNHYKAIGAVVAQLLAFKLPIFVIDDGSDVLARSELADLHDLDEGVMVYRLPENRGKGAAVAEGFRLAIAQGFTHAVQVDADGQHDLSVLPKMLELAQRHPEALISGNPIYDSSAPKARTIGRWITHVWVWIETLSFRITDSMCGFRVYPLGAVQKLLSQHPVRPRMDFDTDIMVRLFWMGVPPIMVPVRVVYPPDNTSNFDMLHDNLRISWMHTRLVCSMLLHLPLILSHRPPRINAAAHWSKLAERGTYWGLRITAAVCSLFGKRGCLFLLSPVVIYFYLTDGKRRDAIRIFLTRTLKRQPGFSECFRPFSNFFERSLDVFLAWAGKLESNTIVPTDHTAIEKFLGDPQGSLIVVAHLGNANIAQALLPAVQRKRMTILAHTHHAENFNRVLSEFCPGAAMNIFQVTEIGPETVIELKQRAEAGGRIVIAGDRTAVLSDGHAAKVPFLGTPAPFPHGPWVLASLLDCPVYLLFCVKDGQHYRLTLELFEERIALPRDVRMEKLREFAGRYAQRLEHYATEYPFQWYNFFDFWAENDDIRQHHD